MFFNRSTKPTRLSPGQKINYLKGRVERIKQLFHSFKTEMRELSKSDARPFEEVR